MGQSSSSLEMVSQTNASSTSRMCPVSHECPVTASSEAKCPVQSADLPPERSESSIPRDSSAKWLYPSPQQFYNALVRKGWETPEEHIVTMVDIHNFLNEEAWEEVKKWEKRRTEYVPLHMSENGYSHPPVMIIFNSLASGVSLVRCHRRRGCTRSQVGFCPRASGVFYILTFT